MVVDKQVIWEKIQGKPDASMTQKTGEGFLGSLPKVGERLYIDGDRGVTTSMVKTVEIHDDHYLVTTKNSVYKLTLRNPISKEK